MKMSQVKRWRKVRVGTSILLEFEAKDRLQGLDTARQALSSISIRDTAVFNSSITQQFSS